MTTVGLGVEEIRIREESGAFRVFYIARLDEVVYVLHAFQKKSQQTPQKDIELGQKRYRDLMKWRSQNGKR
jgi:phage-related protein